LILSQLDKLIAKILRIDKNLRFEELEKVLKRMGYTISQAGTGSSHYSFRKSGMPRLTIVKNYPIKKVYVEQVKNAILEALSEVSDDD